MGRRLATAIWTFSRGVGSCHGVSQVGCMVRVVRRVEEFLELSLNIGGVCGERGDDLRGVYWVLCRGQGVDTVF